MNKKSIRNRSLYIATTFTALMLIIIYFLIINTIKNNIIDSVGSLRFSQSKIVAENIESFIIKAQEHLTLIGRSIEKEELFSPEKIQKRFNQLNPSLTIFDNGLFFFNEKGELLAELPFINKERIGMSFGFREYFKTTMQTKKPYISLPYISSKTGKYSLMFTYPIIRNGDVIYILAGGINIQSVLNPIGNLQNSKVGQNGYYYIYNTNRIFIFHPDNSRIGKADVPYGVNKLFDATIDGFEGYGETVNSRSIRYLASFVRINKTDWILGSNLLYSEAMEPLSNLSTKLVIIFILIFIIIATTIYVAFYLFSKPMQFLTEKIENLSLDYPDIGKIDIEPKYYYKEFSPLIEKTNLLADNLKKSYETLFNVAKTLMKGQMIQLTFNRISKNITLLNTKLHLMKKVTETGSIADLLRDFENILIETTDITKLLSLRIAQTDIYKLIDFGELIQSYLSSNAINKEIIDAKLEVSDKIYSVYADEYLSLQMIENILINAQEAQVGVSKEPLRITLSNFDNEEGNLPDLTGKKYLKISIEDNGVGIEKRFIDKVFAPFWSTKPNRPGIGLTIAKDIAKNLGGDIFIESELGKGTKVTIYLPHYTESPMKDKKN